MAKKIHNQNLLIIDGAFAKSVVEHIKTTEGKPTPDKAATETSKTTDRYSVVVVDDDRELLDLIETTCDYSGDFKCTVSQDPQKTFADAELHWLQDQSAPDLFVIDLELAKDTMQGLELIDKLVDELEIPSAIMAMSSDLSGRRLLEVVGIRRAVRAISKPLDYDKLLAEMRDLADIGRNRILYGKDPAAFFDETRSQRQVFLSYSSLDDDTATAISNSLENKRISVFFAPDSIREGENIPQGIRSALKGADIFIPLISANFASSRHCLSELANALDLKKLREKERPLRVIPVLYDTTDKAQQDTLIRKCIRENKPLNITSDNLIDGIQKILIRVQSYLSRL